MNLPNALTLSRIFVVPLLVVVLLTKFPGELFGLPQQVFGLSIFVAASITDWLDGYLARKRGQVSTLGTLLDPIADKLLISAALVSLVENRLAPAWAIVIIIGREFAVTGLRSIAAAEGFTISASKKAKFKMLTQVVAVTLLILGAVPGGEYGLQPPKGVNPEIAFASFEETGRAIRTIASTGRFGIDDARVLCYGAGRAMLWIVVFFALWSMYDYFTKFYGKVRDRIEVRERRRLRILRRRRKKSSSVLPSDAARREVRGSSEF
ncbi:MAG TPA: CDP-diacylglycerol--glycerol-3-phosphate 3-phosphatidyltransferase [Blastocatellia bacterium]|nr:CDP-diacylglycerol--glycerol-3-phosphate 3-phosphatidyltransferase [Blastocatellia bacterium]